MIKVNATGFEDQIEEDRPALYLSSGAGNVRGVQEAHLIYVDTAKDIEVVLGWFPVHALRDALNALDHAN